jgi:hypothetical protein
VVIRAKRKRDEQRGHGDVACHGVEESTEVLPSLVRPPTDARASETVGNLE